MLNLEQSRVAIALQRCQATRKPSCIAYPASDYAISRRTCLVQCAKEGKEGVLPSGKRTAHRKARI